VQVAVRPPDADDDGTDGMGIFGDVSTKSVAKYIDTNIVEVSNPEPDTSAITSAYQRPAAPTATATAPASAFTSTPPAAPDESSEAIPELFGSPGVSGLARHAAPVTVAVAVTLLVGWLLWGRKESRPLVQRAAAPIALAVPAPAAAAVLAPAPAPAAVLAPPPASAEMPTAELAATAATPEPAPELADRHCRARVISRPTGAVVSLGTRRLGTTPVDLDGLPCAGAELVLSHARYSPAVASVPEGSDAAAPLFVRLARPRGRLALTSTPANATFKVNRHVVGQGPQNLAVMRYERVRIEASLAGHRPWHRDVYVTEPLTRINATLVRGR
jgi:hypothetical protein